MSAYTPEDFGLTQANGWITTPDNKPKFMQFATVDDLELYRVSNVTTLVAGTTYFVSDASDLLALQSFGTIGAGVTIKLTNDIDMSGVTTFTGIKEFNGTLDGQWIPVVMVV